MELSLLRLHPNVRWTGLDLWVEGEQKMEADKGLEQSISTRKMGVKCLIMVVLVG